MDIETRLEQVKKLIANAHKYDMKRVYYVYVLLDSRRPGVWTYPINGTSKSVTFSHRPFYVGKGKGRRVRSHIKEALSGGRSFKSKKIRKILSDGGQVITKVFGLGDEESALAKEYLLIESIGRREDGGPLTNKALGMCSATGYRHTEEHKEYMSALFSGVKRTKEVREKIVTGLERARKEGRLSVTEEGRRRRSRAVTKRWDRYRSLPDDHPEVAAFRKSRSESAKRRWERVRASKGCV
jgi:hypothetical protein